MPCSDWQGDQIHEEESYKVNDVPGRPPAGFLLVRQPPLPYSPAGAHVFPHRPQSFNRHLSSTPSGSTIFTGVIFRISWSDSRLKLSILRKPLPEYVLNLQRTLISFFPNYAKTNAPNNDTDTTLTIHPSPTNSKVTML